MRSVAAATRGKNRTEETRKTGYGKKACLALLANYNNARNLWNYLKSLRNAEMMLLKSLQRENHNMCN